VGHASGCERRDQAGQQAYYFVERTQAIAIALAAIANAIEAPSTIIKAVERQ
jgi:hypothetical protein